ncbi:COG4223 family protein [Celeribacter indicus]|uniref:Mitochondrial inner membrane protein n=1 Tax=Celeribacter indicus TaxID=1208324 RepID=A0A0B5DX77_9RHOB|nr:hypothetical protein [Celeribacter indicus]AJE44857.1 hypothetical protein P73_0142 [Celeribacter indicus]SDX23395.1 hypothetical protein SAMN05443573_11836 [Celeribacter indicus]
MQTAEDASEESGQAQDEALPDAEMSETAEPETEDDPQAELPPASDPAAAPPPETVIVKRGGVLAALLGGVICLALGYAAAQFVKPEGWPFPGSNTEEVSARVDRLQDEVAALTAATEDRAAADRQVQERLEARLSEMDPAAAVEPLSDRITALEDRLTTLEARPVEEAVLSPEATEAYERRLTEMQERLNSEIERLHAAESEAQAQEAVAAAATLRSELRARVEAGDPFVEELDALGTEVPEGLRAAAAEGIPGVTELQDSYPEAARRALTAASRAAYEAGEEGWVRTALRTQLGLRSTRPKVGDDPDAILSRAEQSVREADFAEAIATLEALPEAGRAEMQPWIDTAQRRVDVLTALNDMSGQ